MNDDLSRIMKDAQRKERRDGIRLTIIGVLFLFVGVFILAVVRDPWMGTTGLLFGAMGIIVGIIKTTGSDSATARIWMIIACALFALVGLLMVITGLVSPESMGWRGGLSAIIIGAIGLAFFGAGTVALIVKEVRRRRR